VRPDSGRAVGEEHRDAVDDGIAAGADGAADGVRFEGEGCVADGAGEEFQGVWIE
jgi:hypothetical protein